MGKKKIKRVKHTNPVEEFKTAIGKYLVVPKNNDYIDFVFAVVYANRLDVKPVWAYLIGPSSAGKTMMIDPMEGHSSVVAIDTLSKASLLPGTGSGRPPKDEKKAGKKAVQTVKNSLLSMCNEKMLVIKDFSSLLNEDYKELKAILGILRSAYDGKFAKSFGNIGRIEIDCRFGMIAAVTDAIDNHTIMDAELGQRFIGYRMPDISAEEEMAICDAVFGNKVSEVNEALHEAMGVMLDREPPEPTMTKRQADAIKYTAREIALARTGISRDKYTRDPHICRPERLARLYSQLISLCKGVAMARGHEEVKGEDVVFARHVAIHTLSLDMLRLLNMFMDKGGLTVEHLVSRFGWCKQTCIERLQNLVLIEICDSQVIAGEKGRDEIMWTLKKPDQWEKMLKKLDYDIAYSGKESYVGKEIVF